MQKSQTPIIFGIHKIIWYGKYPLGLSYYDHGINDDLYLMDNDANIFLVLNCLI